MQATLQSNAVSGGSEHPSTQSSEKISSLGVPEQLACLLGYAKRRMRSLS